MPWLSMCLSPGSKVAMDSVNVDLVMGCEHSIFTSCQRLEEGSVDPNCFLFLESKGDLPKQQHMSDVATTSSGGRNLQKHIGSWPGRLWSMERRRNSLRAARTQSQPCKEI